MGFGFSALQRAENSSILGMQISSSLHVNQFQCSSASRKFLNRVYGRLRRIPQQSFSALQRAENSSMDAGLELPEKSSCVSVLFSEPKIPQSVVGSCCYRGCNSFSALQRAENSSIRGKIIRE